MKVKRMRIFAGPNGSGKTTIIQQVKSKVNLGIYINADDIELELRTTKKLSLDKFEVKISEQELQNYFRTSQFSPIKRKEITLWKKVKIEDNSFTTSAKIDSYLAADLADFLRHEVLKNNLSLAYETVMSHSGKIDFLEKALANGYRVYLYFIATESPEINISRVQARVSLDGHAVSPKIITSRFYRSLENLKRAVMKSTRAYLFDNSGSAAYMIAEITNGVDVRIIDTNAVPFWFTQYLVEK